MDVFDQIRDALKEILDIEPENITPETYIIRDLDAESIDLMELSVELNEKFGIEIIDDRIFLRTVRLHLNEAEKYKKEAADVLKNEYPFLGVDRIQEILKDLDGGPVLKMKDLVSYIECEAD
ncbi:MAG: acyl carrier protein [Desulfobacterales bacterium]|nr:acyl carrier protein [Desulfobacterales bacterium]